MTGIIGGIFATLSPFSPASKDEDDGGDAVDEDDGASSSSDAEMTAFQWLTLCHSWQKGRVILGMRVVVYLGGRVSYRRYFC